MISPTSSTVLAMTTRSASSLTTTGRTTYINSRGSAHARQPRSAYCAAAFDVKTTFSLSADLDCADQLESSNPFQIEKTGYVLGARISTNIELFPGESPSTPTPEYGGGDHLADEV